MGKGLSLRIWRQEGLIKKLSGTGSYRERRQVRLALLGIFGLVLLAVGGAIGSRELPRFWQKLTRPQVIRQSFPGKEPTATPTPVFAKESQAVEEIIKPLRGKYGVFFQVLESGQSFSLNGREKFESASLNKLPVLLTLYRQAQLGKINLDETYKLQAADKRSGAGSLQYKPAGFEITLRGMAELMGKQSDNTAFNILSRLLGAETIQQTINDLGMKDTSFADWQTTPEDIGLFFRKLYREQVVSETNRDEILSFLTKTIWEDRIPAGVPKEVRVAHKIGTEVGVISDAGIVFAREPYILAILSEGVNEIEAQKALVQISAKIYELTQK